MPRMLAGQKSNLLRRLQACSMLLPGQSLVFLARHTSPSRSTDCTGYVRPSTSNAVGDVDLPLSALCSPRSLSIKLTRVVDIPSRRRLRSSATDVLLVRPTCLVTVGDRAFPVTAAKLWNELPNDLTASVSLTAFRRQLKIFLFRVSYPDS